MSMMTEILAALWLTVLPAQQVVDAVPIGTEAALPGEPPVVDARLEIAEVLHEGDRHERIAIRATCPVNARCRIPGLVARRVAFEVESIRWTAGAGWPEYRDASPRNDHSPAMRYPGALVHQLVLAIGAGEVSFLVNDDKYDDNEGTFTVLIESWE